MTTLEELLLAVESRKISPEDAGTVLASAARPPAPRAVNDAQSLVQSLIAGGEAALSPSARAAVPLAVLKEELATTLSTALYLQRDAIDDDMPFVDLGLDSIVGVEWVRAINKRYEISIPTTKLYDYPTVRKLADYLANDVQVSRAGPPRTQPARVVQAGSGGLVLATVHSLDEVQWAPWPVAEPGEDEVTIRVHASAVNFPDVLCIQGLYPTMPEYPFVPGFEVAGTVVKVGRNVSGVQVNQEVIAITGRNMGGHASHVNVDANHVMRMPGNLTFEEACSIPVVFATASYALELGRMSAGEHVLIHTATGGCGLAALQIARLKGCVCYGTSSKPGKLDLLRRLGVEHVLDYTGDFDQEIRRITAGRGVDAVLNTLSGEAIQKGLNCLAAGGRYLEIAVQALRTSQRLDLSHLVENQSVHSIDLRRLALGKGRGWATSSVPIASLFEEQLLVPIVSRIYPLSQLREAMRYVAEGQHIGKVVISHTREEMVDCTDQCLERLEAQRQRRAPAAELSQPAVMAPPVVPKPDSRASLAEGIAVIGMSGAFPKAASLQEFWNNLAQGRDCISEVPADRWPLERFYDADAATPGKTYCRWMGLVEEMDRFDPAFFSISPLEAESMDPQQRLFLEHSWSCIESAALDPTTLSGTRCGVYVGCGPGDYGQFGEEGGLTAQGLTGNSSSILCGRIAYFLDLKGPCMAIDTACSSSLVAIAGACDALVAGRVDLALAGGVSVMTGPSFHIVTSKAGMLSRAGRCFSFDGRADGFVPGEGVGVLLLKRHADATRDGDCIRGVIRGWDVNHDGRTNGMTAPSVTSQILLEKTVYERFGIHPETISCVEAHGTGTRLGDPIEVEALTQSFRAYTDKQSYCALGSVKSNIGHLLAAAGVSGVIKVLLALQHRQLPPTVQFESLNEHVALDKSPFYINTELRPWAPPAGQVRRAAISSFGFSGTNAHLVIDEAVDGSVAQTAECYITESSPAVIVLSAKNRDRLQAKARQLLDHVLAQAYGDTDLANIAYTLQVGRAAMENRLAFTARTIAELQDKLSRFLQEKSDKTRIEECYVADTKQDREAMSMFTTDDVMQDAIRTWIRRGQFSNLMQLWTRGLSFDWSSLYGTGSVYGSGVPKRVVLPTYPFARTRCWISAAPKRVAEVPVAQTLPSLQAVLLPAPAKVEPIERPLRVSLASLNTVPTVIVEAPDVPKVTLGETIDRVARAPEPIAATVSVQELEEELAQSLASALHMETGDIDVEKPFMELGLDSVIGVEWIHALRRRYGVAISAAKLYDHPSIMTLAQWLVGQIGEGLARREAPVIEPEIAIEEPVSEIVTLFPLEDPLPPAPPVAARAVTADQSSIAIVGISGRYPGATDLTAYWENLAAGRCSIEEIRSSRWHVDDYYDPKPGTPGRIYCKWLGQLDDIDCFDPLFFNISPAEAQLMDPQQRIFMQEGYRAFEDAGYTATQLSNRKCGVYLGIMGNEYGGLLREHGAGDTTGNNSAIAAARIAYHMNLKGPAIPIDTACSSSLVATHLACQALRAREIEMALIGGVTLYLTADSFIGMCSAVMLSPIGRCRSFDNSADGFVPGEGAGALVLKRLDDAEADGDHIYGVIIGSGINQDGKTNGITAPSSSSQMDLVRDVYARNGIHPESISYVEMHGTGTKLGDPIELEALGTVFSEHTDRRGFCAIGSVKSNIGHTSAAAGIAGIHKVLLSLRHGELVPTLNFVTPNEHFDFARSAFVVNTERRTWTSPAGTRRRAAVSSFGFSGTNAHLVIEEYVPIVGQSAARPAAPTGAALLVLSARNEERLKDQARTIRAHIARSDCTDADLFDIAYTLQTRREALEHRLAVIADSKAAALQLLEEFSAGRHGKGVFVGHAKRNKEGMSAFQNDDDVASLVGSWSRKGKLDKLAKAWASGLAIPWETLYADRKPRRVRLPTYPFARDRHWVEKTTVPAARIEPAVAPSAASLHPLVQRNSSSLKVQRFSSTFTGEEFYLRDHKVNSKRILPGVAYLEMARAAFVLSQEGADPSCVALEGVTWLQPLAVERAQEVHVELARPAQGGVEFEIYTGSSLHADAPDRVVHAQGRAVLVSPASGALANDRADLDALRGNCHPEIDGAACYAAFAQIGLEYGPAHRGLASLRVGTDSDGRQFALGRVRLPECVSDSAKSYRLHPSVLDAALQVSAGLALMPAGQQDSSPRQAAVPFALESLEVLRDSPASAWVVVRSADVDRSQQKLDIDIYDDSGELCVRLRGFMLRVLRALPAGQGTLLVPRWQVTVPEKSAPWMQAGEAALLVGGTPDEQLAWRNRFPHLHVLNVAEAATSACIEKLGRVQHVIWLAPPNEAHSLTDDALIVEQSAGVIAVYRFIKTLLALGYGTRPLNVCVMTRQTQAVRRGEALDPTHSSIHGLVGSLAKEYAGWKIRLVDVPAEGEDASTTPQIDEILGLPPDPQGNAWVYRHGEWYRLSLLACNPKAGVQPRYRKGGVYVVIGGAGGIGEALSEHLIRQHGARMVWIGRREVDDRLREKIARLAKLGPAPVYFRADATDRASLEAAYRSIKAQYGEIHGLVHAAVALLDKSLEQMDEARFRAGLQAKVDVSVRLAQVFQGEALDFVLFFSSFQSFIKAGGQSNYAAGCAFKDAFAHQMACTWSCPVRVMNWGYWGSVGVVASEQYRQRMAQQGIDSIEPAEGMAALDQLLTGPAMQLAFLKAKLPQHN